MHTWPLAAFRIVAAALALSGCQRSPAGRYQLDLAETTTCVEQAVRAHPEDASAKDATLKMLREMRVEVLLDAGGKLESTTVLAAGQAPKTLAGSWELHDKRVTVTVQGEVDSLCELDGKRLRCKKTVPYGLFTDYVLVRE